MKVVCSCGKTLQVPEALANKRVRCPYCKQSLEAVAAAAEAVPADLGLGSQPATSGAPAPDDHLAALAAAIGGAPPKPQAAPPTAPGKPAAADEYALAGKPAAARPKSPPVSPALPAKRRDRMPLILLSVAGGVLLIVLIVVLANSGNDAKTPEPQVPVVPTTKVEAPTPARANDSFFGNVPDNRTYADYLKEKAEREQKERDQRAAPKK